MKAIGLIETKGLIGAIEACDIMLKTADVQLYTKEFVGGGLVTVTITGDVAAVKTSIDAATSAVQAIGSDYLHSAHVIPKPDDSLEKVFTEKKQVPHEASEEMPGKISQEIPEETSEEISKDASQEIPQENLHEEASESSVSDSSNLKKAESDAPSSVTVDEEEGFSESRLLQLIKDGKNKQATEMLKKLRVVDLRELVKKQQKFTIAKKDIYRTSKDQLIDALIDYFSKN